MSTQPCFGAVPPRTAATAPSPAISVSVTPFVDRSIDELDVEIRRLARQI